MKKDTQGADVHTPSERKQTDEIFLMIVLFYEGVKGKAGGEQPHVCNSGWCWRLSETLYQHQVCNVLILLIPYYVGTVWGDGQVLAFLLQGSYSAYLAGSRIE